MTPEHDPYDAHLQAMGRALRTAPGRRTRQHRTRPLLITGLGAALAAAVLVLLLGAPGRSPVDVLGRAEAALGTPDELVHYVVRDRVVQARPGLRPPPVSRSFFPCPPTGTTEVWQSERLNRWRAVLPVAPNGPRCSQTYDGRRGIPVDGPTQSAWNNGTTSYYVEQNDTLDTVRGYSLRSSARLTPISDRNLGGGDPVQTLRGMLAAGRLTSRGATTLNGRRVRTFSGTSTQHGRGGTDVTTVLYAVDADTFRPVRSIVTRRVLRRGGPPTPRGRDMRRWMWSSPSAHQLDFLRYERLPLNAATRRLLEIRPARPPKDTTDMTQAELRRSIKRRTAAENREGAARARRANRERAARARDGRGG
ncbi:hypothetical protein [Patulibacter americanus]|uniref:hypothetical protein n=1 Tax=Patulibacter americanus TaxID=588672 RepID=UPI0003B6BF96|nr:hypothetical protein [Patulibacter americanus]